jgi:hypothetical protein
MVKPSAANAAALMKDIRTLLDARAEERIRAAAPKSSLKSLGVRSSQFKPVLREVLAKAKPAPDLETAVAVVDLAAGRKVREEILVALELLERFRREFTPALFGRLEKWSSAAEDLEIAESLGRCVAAPLLALEPARAAQLRKWAKLRSLGKRRLAVIAAASLVSDGRREAAQVLELCELLLHEDHPLLVGEVAALLRDTTKIDAKAVQDFLFRRSVDGNPDILRAGSQNLDAARRAALIAKLEAQSALAATLVTS